MRKYFIVYLAIRNIIKCAEHFVISLVAPSSDQDRDKSPKCRVKVQLQLEISIQWQ